MAGDHFGCSVAIGGDWTVLGSAYDEVVGFESGSALAVSGDTVVAGVHLADEVGGRSGSAYMFGIPAE